MTSGSAGDRSQTNTSALSDQTQANAEDRAAVHPTECNLLLSLGQAMNAQTERTRQLINGNWNVIGRTSIATARSRQLVTSTWERIHDSDAHMAAQAGRFRLSYVSSLSRQQPADPQTAPSDDDEPLAG